MNKRWNLPNFDENDHMRKLAIAISALVLFFAFSITAQEKPVELKDFGGMSGCWSSAITATETTQSEQWMEPLGTSMLGMGRTVSRGKTTGYEFMRIEKRDDGIYFVSRPKENPADTDFKLISSKGGRFVFENTAHDFPQRVIYSFTASKMTGRIEGVVEGKPMGMDFPMVRAKCR